MSVQTIYKQLRDAGMTHAGACGLMGNMQAESVMRADNAQDTYGIPDAFYVSTTDAGTRDFVNDKIGFGLCQWTLASRKRKLLEYARKCGCSIANENMQVQFCINELATDFPSVWNLLTSTSDMKGASDTVCRVYENPAIKNFKARYDFAKSFDYLASGTDAAQDTSLETEQTDDKPYWPPRTLQAGKGLTGPDVELCCALLRCHGYALPMREEYDDVIADCILDFQKEAGLKADSIAGIKTFAALWERG